MKPTKNRVYCRDVNRKKMLFETEKKANNFIKFNAEEIQNESGYSPTRAYYCILCGGWHVTSMGREPLINKTDEVLNHYQKYKESKNGNDRRKVQKKK